MATGGATAVAAEVAAARGAAAEVADSAATAAAEVMSSCVFYCSFSFLYPCSHHILLPLYFYFSLITAGVEVAAAGGATPAAADGIVASGVVRPLQQQTAQPR